MTTTTTSRPLTAPSTRTVLPPRPGHLNSGPLNSDPLNSANLVDSTAWDEIVRRYGRVVRGTVSRFRLQDADAGDAEQRTWLQLFEHHDQIRDPDRLGGWLATTARRECLQIMRTRQPLFDATGDPAMVEDAGVDVERQVLEADAARQLWAAVEVLSPRQQRITRALFVDQHGSYAEISQATGVPVGSLGPTRARVLRQLRGLLEESRGPRRQPGESRKLRDSRELCA